MSLGSSFGSSLGSTLGSTNACGRKQNSSYDYLSIQRIDRGISTVLFES